MRLISCKAGAGMEGSSVARQHGLVTLRKFIPGICPKESTIGTP